MPLLADAPEVQGNINVARTPQSGLPGQYRPACARLLAPVAADISVRDADAGERAGYGTFNDGEIPGVDPWAKLKPVGLSGVMIQI